MEPGTDYSQAGDSDGGLPLSAGTRGPLEAALGNDLSAVRLHQGPSAAEAASCQGVRAFTHGDHIWLGAGQSTADRWLMAHEVAHVVQQRAGFAPGLQAAPGRAGRRSAAISVRWSDDNVAFYHRVVNAVDRSRGFRGVRRASLWQPLHGPAMSMHRRLGRRTPAPGPGDRVRLRASAWFDPGAYHGQLTAGALQEESVARAAETTVAGIMTARAALPSGSPTRLGVSEVADLSFTATPRARARDFGGLRWHQVSGAGSLTGGSDGRAVFTAGAAAGSAGLELRVDTGPVAGRVMATLNLQVVDWPQVGGAAGSAEAGTAAMLDLTGGALQHTGSVSARPGSAPDQVTVESPNVTMAATVALRPGATLPAGDSVEAGPVQTLLASERVGVYRRGGVAGGDIIAERRMTVPQTRDAQWRNSPTGPAPSVREPWYSAPVTLNNSHRSDSFSFRDQPSFDLPMRIGAGRLTETRGEDSFITSVGARRGTGVVHLWSSAWQVPWALNLGPGRTGTGAGVGSSDIRFGPPATSGAIAVASVRDALAFTDLAAAMTARADTLMAHLTATRRADTAGWAIIVDALRRLAPSFQVGISVVTAAAAPGSDSFFVLVMGHLPLLRGPFSVASGGSVSLSMPLADLFDVARIGDSDSVEFRLIGAGSPLPSMSWSYPFGDQPTPARMRRGNGGLYTVTGQLR